MSVTWWEILLALYGFAASLTYARLAIEAAVRGVPMTFSNWSAAFTCGMFWPFFWGFVGYRKAAEQWDRGGP